MSRITTPPWLYAPHRWVSTEEFARRFNKSTRHIRRLCQSGDILAFGIRLHHDIPRASGSGRYGRWWIELPPGEP